MKVCIAGGTGLIGSFLLKELEMDSHISSIRAITRRPKENSAKVRWVEADFEKDEDLIAATSEAEVVFCCLGTTMKKAGSKEAFRKVDYTYVISLAKAAKANKARQFSVISAIGADPNSSIFYSKVKGEMEEALRGFGFDELVIFSPSMLLGPRKESRPAEKIGMVLSQVVSPILIGGLSKYKPIHVQTIAEAMLVEAKCISNGNRYLKYKDIVKSASEN